MVDVKREEQTLKLHYDPCCGHRKQLVVRSFLMGYYCDDQDVKPACPNFEKGNRCSIPGNKCPNGTENDIQVARDFLSWNMLARVALLPMFGIVNNGDEQRAALAMLQRIVDVTVYHVETLDGNPEDLLLFYLASNEEFVKYAMDDFDEMVDGATKTDLTAGTKQWPKLVSVTPSPSLYDELKRLQKEDG